MATIINVKTDPEVKKKAQEVLNELGLNLSSAINAYLREIIRTRSVHFSLEEEPSDYLIESINEAEKELREGDVSPSFDNARNAIAWLNNSKRKYVNQIK